MKKKQSNKHQLTINENTNSEDESRIPTQQNTNRQKRYQLYL